MVKGVCPMLARIESKRSTQVWHQQQGPEHWTQQSIVWLAHSIACHLALCTSIRLHPDDFQMAFS